jgi:hypothetical protein
MPYDPVEQLIFQNLQGGQTGESSLGNLQGGQAGETFLGNLTQFARDYTRARLGMPQVDPQQLALRRLQILESLRQMREQARVRAPFVGREHEIFQPEIYSREVPTGETTPFGEPYAEMFRGQKYTPQQIMAARLLYGVNLQGTPPEEESKFVMGVRERAESRKLREETAEQTAAYREQRESRLEEGQQARLDYIKEQTRLKKDAAQRAVMDWGTKHEYPVDVVSKAMKSAIDEEGNLDLIKMYSLLPEGKSPKRKRLEQEFFQKIKLFESKLDLSKQQLAEAHKEHKNNTAYRLVLLDVKRYNETLNAFKSDISNIGKDPPPPPDLVALYLYYLDLLARPSERSGMQRQVPATPRQPDVVDKILGVAK